MKYEQLLLPVFLYGGHCGRREDHLPHTYESSSLGLIHCSADYRVREPYRSERRRAGGDAKETP